MSPAEVAAELAGALADHVRAASAGGRRLALAVPGGSVGTCLFPLLAALTVDWSVVDLTVVDERVVAPSDPESNVGLARTSWLDRLQSPGPRVLAPPVALGAPDRIALAWQEALVAALGTPPRLDVAILGVGPDGHVASLFPGHAALVRRDAWAVGIDDAPKPPPRRVTLTLPALEAAREVWIVAFGAQKAAVLAEARGNPASLLPVSQAARRAVAVRWFLDSAAGG